MKTTKTIAKIAGAVLAGMMAFALASCNEKGGAGNIEKLKATAPAAEADFDIKLSSDGSYVTITEYKGKAVKTLAYPATIQGLPVKEIRGSFAEYDNNKVFTAVVIPEGVERIGDFSRGFDNLTTVVLPSTLKYIGGVGGKNLTSVNLPEGLLIIGWAAFSGCEKLTSVNLPEGLLYIGNGAFKKTGLTSVTIPKSLKFLGDRAFEDCDSLAEINIPQDHSIVGFTAKVEHAFITGDRSVIVRTFEHNFEGYFGGEKIKESVALQKLLKDTKAIAPSDEDKTVIRECYSDIDPYKGVQGDLYFEFLQKNK